MLSPIEEWVSGVTIGPSRSTRTIVLYLLLQSSCRPPAGNRRRHDIECNRTGSPWENGFAATLPFRKNCITRPCQSLVTESKQFAAITAARHGRFYLLRAAALGCHASLTGR